MNDNGNGQIPPRRGSIATLKGDDLTRPWMMDDLPTSDAYRKGYRSGMCVGLFLGALTIVVLRWVT